MIAWGISLAILFVYATSPENDSLWLIAAGIFALTGTLGLKSFK